MNPKPYTVKAGQFRDQVRDQFPPAVLELPDSSTFVYRVPLAQLDASTDPDFFERVKNAEKPRDLALVLLEAANSGDPEQQWEAFAANGFTERDFMLFLKDATAEYEDRLGKLRYSR